MSARDLFHESVKKALQKEQWVITDDPLKFKFGDVNFQVDLQQIPIKPATKETTSKAQSRYHNDETN
jgi:hypothetical protein